MIMINMNILPHARLAHCSLILGLLLTAASQSFGQHSIARQWNEMLLEAIRNDFARPTVHARNLFHTSIAMYDSWAVYEQGAETFLLGKQVGSFTSTFDENSISSENVDLDRREALSYACYRLLRHRFMNSPGGEGSLYRFDSLMLLLGFDRDFMSTDYENGSAAALGNYLAEEIIAFGTTDRANEVLDYTNKYYFPFNGFMTPTEPGTQGINDPNRWQPLSFDFFIDQAGFEILGGIPEFLSPEWGMVTPFALSDDDLSMKERNGDTYYVYHDPGPPAYLMSDGSGTSSEYQWGHSLVAIWSAHLDPSDGVMIDISPASIGNIDGYPTTLEGLRDFYDLTEGGDPSQGHPLNPYTGLPYEPQVVPRGDYARVLAEFWADGPDSETPPGHWFTILNYVNDHPLLEKRFRGEGPILSNFEWDVRSYFILGGAMHDAAIGAWGIKGWYDYIRPISAIRYMAEKGQSSDPSLPNYSLEGLPLVDGFIELVMEGDSLVGENEENLHQIKLLAWRGPESIPDPEIYAGGVGWVLAKNWWPYQRPTFVTPPFAGYVSGHSTFSRAAAEVMTLLTGDEFFPGGLGEFEARKNEFLVFEEGPSVDITLQWATYRDASDQTSLSRIWGGIHPPVDDIPGRLIGEKVGIAAFEFAEQYFNSTTSDLNNSVGPVSFSVYPNPVDGEGLVVSWQGVLSGMIEFGLRDLMGQILMNGMVPVKKEFRINTSPMSPGIYVLELHVDGRKYLEKIVIH